MSNTVDLNEFKIEVIEWIHEKDISKHLGIPQREHSLQYGFHISTFNHLEPNIYYVNVSIEKLIDNDITTPSFNAKTTSKFKMRLDKDKSPTELLIFELVNKATYDFSQEYYNRVAGTVLQVHKIPKPKFEDLKKQIQVNLNRWDKDERYKDLN